MNNTVSVMFDCLIQKSELNIFTKLETEMSLVVEVRVRILGAGTRFLVVMSIRTMQESMRACFTIYV